MHKNAVDLHILKGGGGGGGGLNVHSCCNGPEA